MIFARSPDLKPFEEKRFAYGEIWISEDYFFMESNISVPATRNMTFPPHAAT